MARAGWAHRGPLRSRFVGAAALIALVLPLVSCAHGTGRAGAAVPTDGMEADTTRHEWHLTVASWNLMNFSDSKATFPAGGDRNNLLTRMGAIAGAYDVLVFQEVLQTGASITAHLVNYLPAGYACANVSAPSGRVGRRERYVVCAPPANAWGTIAVTGWTDYSTTGANYLAANGTMQPAANVWMRPPVIARITFTPNDGTFQPVTFDVYTNHTKPAYGYSQHARPPGTVAGAPNNSVVHYELRAIEQNQAAGANKMLIGDLNADCASYPTAYRGMDFGAGWSWYVNYGQRTNTAVGSSCGYDRILLNTALNAYYENHGVDYDHFGANTRLDAKRVSDHYPVWVRLGQVQVAKRSRLVAGLTRPVTDSNKQRRFNPSDQVQMTGSGLGASIGSALLYVVPYTTARNYKSNFTYPLNDVRGSPTTVSTDDQGTLQQTILWSNPPPGAFVFVFDANADHQFRLADGDFANYGTQADILVTREHLEHSDVVTLGDNMVLRDVFDLGQAYNVYALAENLPQSQDGYAHLVSFRLLKRAGYSTWEAARAAEIDLATYSIPIALADVGMIDTSELTDADRRVPYRSSPRGDLFLSVWPEPAQLLNATVDYETPPSSVYKPAYAGSGDPPASPDDTAYVDDPCFDAYSSADEEFQEACNVGFLFANYYGNAFNVVLDVDGDGKLGPNDPVDTRDTGDMTKFFDQPGNEVLGPDADGDPAVSEWKEYLSRALSVDLSPDDTYDKATREASNRYACGPTLSKDAFEAWIVPDSQTGFRVLDDDAYHEERSSGTGLYQFDSAFLDGDSTLDGASVCMTGSNLSYGGSTTATNGSSVTSVANTHQFQDAQVHAHDSTLCWEAVEGTAATALVVGASSGWFTAGAGLLVGAVVAAGANIVGGIECGFGSSAKVATPAEAASDGITGPAGVEETQRRQR